MGKTRRCLLDLLLAALCVGLGLLLPWAFRWVHNGEQVLLLLQLPVLLCGMLCGPAYGLSCGLLIVLLPQLFPGAAGVDRLCADSPGCPGGVWQKARRRVKKRHDITLCIK